MSRLEQVILSIVELFDEYAGLDGRKNQISTEELKQLLEKELDNTELKEKILADDIKEAMDMLDKNRDGEINFREFSRCVAILARGYHRQRKGKGGKKGKGKDGAQEDQD
ncbi:S100 calcium binding protein W [Diretmus argenteus]